MPENADLPRLKRALDDAVAALPEGACAHQHPALRRQCREVLLLLLQLRERVRWLAEMFDRPGPGS
jgi:hypothetical protein